MKKFISCLSLMVLLPVAFMAGCGASNTPTSSNSNPTATATTAAFTATPTNTVAPTGPAALSLGAAGSGSSVGPFAVLAGSGITNDAENVCGNIGLYESGGTANSSTGYTAIFTCTNNAYYLQDTNGNAQAAQAAIFAAGTGAYNVGVALPNPTPIPDELGGLSLPPGLYSPTGGAFTLGTGSLQTLTLNNRGGNPDNVYIFETGGYGSTGTLNTSSGSSIILKNVKASNVFWLVYTSATLGQNSSFLGNIMAEANITFGASVTLEGNAYANTAAVVFGANDVIINP